MFSGKLRTRKSAKYMPPGSLIEAIANATVERGSQCGEQDGDSISCQRTIRESQLLRYHYKQELLRMHRKLRSGIQAANAAACFLSGARAPAYCLLAADSICRNLKDLLHRFSTGLVASRSARLWAFGIRAQAIHHQAVYRYDTVAVEKGRQNRTSRRPCQISPTEKKLTILSY